MARLRSSVVVNGTTYVAGTEPPADVAVAITNPDAWESPPDRSDRGDPEEPPRSGAGATTAAWRAYAEALGVEVAGDAGRDDIIAEVDRVTAAS